MNLILRHVECTESNYLRFRTVAVKAKAEVERKARTKTTFLPVAFNVDRYWIFPFGYVRMPMNDFDDQKCSISIKLRPLWQWFCLNLRPHIDSNMSRKWFNKIGITVSAVAVARQPFLSSSIGWILSEAFEDEWAWMKAHEQIGISECCEGM